MDIKINPGTFLTGFIDLPTSKSQTLRALYSAMLAKGTSLVKEALEAEDTEAMIGAMKSFGVKVYKTKAGIIIHSPGWKGLKAPVNCFVNASGITLRFMSAFASLFKTKVTFTGSISLMKQRSIKDLEVGLKRLGVKTESNGGLCPFSVQGPIKKRQSWVIGKDSQPVSALLWALSLKEKKQKLFVMKPEEKPWVELTMSWLKTQNKAVKNQNFKAFSIQGNKKVHPFVYKAPKDFSSAAFMIGAGLVAGINITLTGMNFKDKQGDKALIYLLKKWGACLEISGSNLIINASKGLNTKDVDVKDIIDALPILSVLCILSKNPVRIKGAGGARGKESDRVKSMAYNLSSVGLKVDEQPDGLIVYPSAIKGGLCEGFDDHRIVMSCAILGLISGDGITIKGAEAVNKTYPTFFSHLEALGAKMETL